jgi:hypothetical protein
MATPYSFTQPIRYYKANDPYYYEVDNIPLRQLEENILFIKDKLEGPGGDDAGGVSYLTSNSELNIHNIKQLKPKAIGGRSVKVNAGRFVSRVNDAFDISNALNKLIFKTNSPVGTGLPISNLQQLWDQTTRDEVWNSFIGQSNKKYGMTGLEYTYTFYSSPGGVGSTWGTTQKTPVGNNYPKFKDGVQNVWPGQSVFSLFAAAVKAGTISLNPNEGYHYTFKGLPDVHLAFVQMWRGVFRTSVVDFPDTEISIPAWSDDDFYYLDNSDVAVPITNATQRIDLLVAYSLPIDASSTTIPNFESNFNDTTSPEPQVITAPTLGIVRGAGVGIQKGAGAGGDDGFKVISTLEGRNDLGEPGSSRIAANVNDASPPQGASPTGITDESGLKVHGSFPSPDDLLNIAPLLALDASTDDISQFNLIGQAALPLAYVVVKKGQNLINQNDIIDIRPFLRTTEFTYNERAGVAAANPPLSFSNPAIGAFQLQDIVNNLQSNISTVGTIVSEEVNKSNGRVLYTDYVMGGLAYGVEGTLLTMCDAIQGELDPFGSETQAQTAYQAGDYGGSAMTYDFSVFSSSKNFMEEDTLPLKEAFLEYVYNDRQANLKEWLKDPNTSIGAGGGGTYLGLPVDGGRNIPLYPEWDLPVDGTNANSMMDYQGAGGLRSPKPTWWMWMEGQNPNRPMVYAPGGVYSGKGVNSPQKSYLAEAFGFGYETGKDVGRGMLCISSKSLQVTFPSWVQDYDILVEYVNCGPVAGSIPNGGQDGPQYALGCGLYINKGPLTSIDGSQQAIITVNSASQPWPEIEKGMIGTADSDDAGKILDNEGDSKIKSDKLWQNLSYSVCLPQFRQTHFGVKNQATPLDGSTRFTPKLGAAFYPTVKYTIIGYETPPLQNNISLKATNNYTAVPTGDYDIGRLLTAVGETTYQQNANYPPNGFTAIDIANPI